MDIKLLETIKNKLNNNEDFVVVTVVDAHKSTPRKSGAKMIVSPDGTIEGTIGGGALEYQAIEDAKQLLEKGENKLKTYNIGDDEEILPTEKILPSVCGGKTTLFFEVYRSKEEFFIVGAGHVGRELGKLFEFFDFNYSVVDNREGYLKKEFFPTAKKFYQLEYEELLEKLPITSKSWIIIMTHAHIYDALCLEKAIQSPASYIGMIGSSNKVITNFNQIMKKGLKIDERVWAPIGVKLGDSSPKQVAFSIMVQIMALKEKKRKIIHFRDYFVKKNWEKEIVKKLWEEGGWKDEEN